MKMDTTEKAEMSDEARRGEKRRGGMVRDDCHRDRRQCSVTRQAQAHKRCDVL